MIPICRAIMIATLCVFVISGDEIATASAITSNTTPSPDFDGDGTVGFSDLLIFAGAFGSSRGDSQYEARFDLNGDGSVGFADLLIFAENFGSRVPPSGGSGTTAPAPGAWKLYWTDLGRNNIQRSNLDGSSVEVLVTRMDSPLGVASPAGIALDVSRGKMYWTDNSARDRIQRSNLDGSSVEVLVTTGVSGPEGIALDVANGKMYWTNVHWPAPKIKRSNLDGTVVEDLVTGMDSPLGIALDVAAGKMYWTDANAGPIQRSNFDGSGVEDLVTTGLRAPAGIALDVAGGKMYWTDGRAEKIQRSNLDGSGVEDLVTTGLDFPKGIALDVAGGKMYWTDVGTDKIQRSNLDGSGVEDLATIGLVYPKGIALGLVPVKAGPDLVVTTSVDDNTLTTGQSFTLRATVRNQGNASAAATTLRYYRSINASISTDNVEVGTDTLSSLSAGGTSAESISLNVPSDAGTYHYGACVESVSGESNTGNNCSSGVSVTVSSSGGGGGSRGACTAGLVVNAGESCTYKGYSFTVSSSGRGSIAFHNSATGIDARNSTVNGVRWNFHATKNSNSNSWTIRVAD